MRFAEDEDTAETATAYAQAYLSPDSLRSVDAITMASIRGTIARGIIRGNGFSLENTRLRCFS